MTEDGSSASSTLIKTDRLGRMRTSAERREMLLDEFEQSGMSGAEFAKMIGVGYSTFAGWRQRRAKERKSRSPVPSTAPDSLQMVEAVVAPQSARSRVSGGLTVHLPGQARLELSRADQLPMACALLQSLVDTHRSC